MNRRNFFKVVTGFVAGIFVSSTAKPKTICRLKSGQPGPTTISASSSEYPSCYGYYKMAGVKDCSVDCEYKDGCEESCSTSIDPNSEWAKQKYLTLDEIIEIGEEKRYEIFGFKTV